MASYKLIVKNAKVILKTVTNAVLNITGIKDLLTGSGSVDSNTKIDWTLQHYTNTAANFTSTNPILLVGQVGIETDDLLTAPKYKIGDGVTAWNTLPYNSSGGGGLSGLTTNKVLKATSSTTAGDSSITDTCTNNYSSILVRDSGVSSNFTDGLTASYSSIDEASASLGFYDGTNSQLINCNILNNRFLHSIKNTFDSPLHEFNNSVTKGGVEVATVNDIPSVAGLAPIASPTFTGTATSPILVISGTGGNGYINVSNQSTTPTTPASSTQNIYTNSLGKLARQSSNTQIATHRGIIYSDVATSSAITGSTANTLMKSGLVKGNTFSTSATDTVRLESIYLKTGVNAACQCRYYANTSNTLSGATLLGLFQTGATVTWSAFVRNGIIKTTTNTEFLDTATSSVSDMPISVVGVSGGKSSINIDWTVDVYLIAAAQNLSAADSTVVSMLKIYRD